MSLAHPDDERCGCTRWNWSDIDGGTPATLTEALDLEERQLRLATDGAEAA